MRDWKIETPKIRDNVILNKICGEYVLFAIKDAADYCRHMQTLNETAGYFWELLEKGFSYTQMVKKASEDFDVAESVIAADLNNLLNQFDELNYFVYYSK